MCKSSFWRLPLICICWSFAVLLFSVFFLLRIQSLSSVKKSVKIRWSSLDIINECKKYLQSVIILSGKIHFFCHWKPHILVLMCLKPVLLLMLQFVVENNAANVFQGSSVHYHYPTDDHFDNLTTNFYIRFELLIAKHLILTTFRPSYALLI